MTKEKIEEIQIEEDIQVAMVKADSFPDGVMGGPSEKCIH
jgi:hypothetical protein